MKPFVCVWLACLLLGASGPGRVLAANLDDDDQDQDERLYEPRRQDDRQDQGRARSYRRDDLPERYTIRKGRKCEVRCERRAGTRDYQCHEYRC